VVCRLFVFAQGDKMIGRWKWEGTENIKCLEKEGRYQKISHVIDVRKLNKDSIIIDAGMSVGKFTQYIRTFDHLKETYIIGVECGKSNLGYLHSIEESLGNVKIIKKGLTSPDFKKPRTFIEYPGLPGWGNVNNLFKNDKMNVRVAAQEHGEPIEYVVNFVSLGDIIQNQKLTKIDYLKLDVVGEELNIFNGLTLEQADMIDQLSFEFQRRELARMYVYFLNHLGFNAERVERSEIYAWK
jgi:hypothetical protein